MLFFLIPVCLASEPVAGVHAGGSVGPGDAGAGLGATYGLNVGSFDFELAADATAGTDAVGYVRPQLRFTPGDVHTPGPHLVGGAGLFFAPEGERPVAHLGVGADLMRGPWRPRVQAIWAGAPGDPWRVFLQVGLVHRPKAAPIAPKRVAQFDAAMVWVPGPVCEWLPPDEAGPAFSRVDADAASATRIPSPPGLSVDDGDRGPPQGDLVIAAYPGDTVTVDGAPLKVAPDGIAWVARTEGPAVVRIVGGGRSERSDVAVAAGATLWVGTDPIDDLLVSFSAGSATIEGEAASSIDTLVDRLGAWTVEIWGSASPEGDAEANQILADARALAVAERLKAGGVPEARIRLLPSRPPVEGIPLEVQRVAVVRPVVQP